MHTGASDRGVCPGRWANRQHGYARTCIDARVYAHTCKRLHAHAHEGARLHACARTHARAHEGARTHEGAHEGTHARGPRGTRRATTAAAHLPHAHAREGTRRPAALLRYCAATITRGAPLPHCRGKGASPRPCPSGARQHEAAREGARHEKRPGHLKRDDRAPRPA